MINPILQNEARQRIALGEDGSRQVHIIWRPDGSINCLSTSFHREADLSDHPAQFHSLNHFAGES